MPKLSLKNAEAVCGGFVPSTTKKHPASMSLKMGGYKCFGCGVGGRDAIDFVAKYFNITLPEAAEKLGEDFNLPFRRKKSRGGAKIPPTPSKMWEEKKLKKALDDWRWQEYLLHAETYRLLGRYLASGGYLESPELGQFEIELEELLNTLQFGNEKMILKLWRRLHG